MTDDYDLFENIGGKDETTPPPPKRRSPILDSGDGDDSMESFILGAGVKLEDELQDKSKPWMKFHKFHLVKTASAVRDLVDKCIENKVCSLDLETQGLDNRIDFDHNGKPKTRHQVVGYCIGLNGEGYYIPVRHHWDKLYNSKASPNCDDVAAVDAEIARLCRSSQPVLKDTAVDKLSAGSSEWVSAPQVVIRFWNSKFDQEFLYPITGIDWWHPDSFEDGMLAAYVIYTDDLLSLKINAKDKLSITDPVTKEVHPYIMITLKELFPNGAKKLDFSLLQPSTTGSGWHTVLYGCSDAICTDLLCVDLVPKAVDKKYGAIYRLEKQVVQAIRMVERYRVSINVDEIRNLLQEAESELEAIETKLSKIALAKSDTFIDFTPSSSTQVADLLFGPNGFDLEPKPEKTDGDQYKTDEDTLESYRDNPNAPEVIGLIIKHRQIQKVTGTYLLNLANNTDEFGQLRLNFVQTGAATGRFTAPAGDPEQGFGGIPIQGIPAKNDPTKPAVAHSLRRMFQARKGYKILKADYASQELRVAANVSGEDKWVAEYKKELLTGEPADLHYMTAQAFFPGLTKDSPDYKLKRGMGKCAHPSSLIYVNGAYQTMESLGEFPLLADNFCDFKGTATVDTGGVSVKALYQGGLKPLVAVVTNRGVVTCTEQHLFMTAAGTLKKAEDLEPLEVLQPLEIHPLEVKQEVNPDKAFFAGLALGGATVTVNGLIFPHGRVSKKGKYKVTGGKHRNLVADLMDSLGFEYHFETRQVILPPTYFETMTEWGILKGGHKTSSVPQWVIDGGPEAFKHFLAGYCEGDSATSFITDRIYLTFRDSILIGQMAMLTQASGYQIAVMPMGHTAKKKLRLRINCSALKEFREYLRTPEKKLPSRDVKADTRKDPSLNNKPLKVITVLDAGLHNCIDITLDSKDHIYRIQGHLTHNTANFALVYGGGVGAVQRATGCDMDEGKRLLDAFHKSVPKFSAWVSNQHKFVAANLGVQTAFRRFIAIPDAKITEDEWLKRKEASEAAKAAKNKKYVPIKYTKKQAAYECKKIINSCQRQSTNYPIQGSGADILKISLTYLTKEFFYRGWLKSGGGDDSIRLIMTVHDEIVYEVKEERLAEAIPILKKIMEYPSTLAKWEVPLIAEVEIGDTWNAKLDWNSMLLGDPKHPIPAWLQGHTTTLDPTIHVIPQLHATNEPVLLTAESIQQRKEARLAALEQEEAPTSEVRSISDNPIPLASVFEIAENASDEDSQAKIELEQLKKYRELSSEPRKYSKYVEFTLNVFMPDEYMAVRIAQSIQAASMEVIRINNPDIELMPLVLKSKSGYNIIEIGDACLVNPRLIGIEFYGRDVSKDSGVIRDAE